MFALITVLGYLFPVYLSSNCPATKRPAEKKTENTQSGFLLQATTTDFLLLSHTAKKFEGLPMTASFC